jgi:hypothetical protein
MKRASQAATGSRMNPSSQAKKKIRIRSEKTAQTSASWPRTTKKRAIEPRMRRTVSQRRSRGVRKTAGGGPGACDGGGCAAGWSTSVA